MRRYIDADKLLTDEILHILPFGCGRASGRAVVFVEDIEKIPTADVEEVRHGEWQYEQLDEYKFYKVTCPYCEAYYYGNYDAYHDPDDFNYCPNCGAKMDGERSENGK